MRAGMRSASMWGAGVLVALAALAWLGQGALAEESATDATVEEPKRVLLVGDSMVWELGLAMEPLMEARGYKFSFKHKTSDSIRGYSSSNSMRTDIGKYRPDVVMIHLGANESLIPNPTGLEKPIKKIVSQIGDRPCYWIGPPMWKQDTGLVKVLEESVAPCRFYNSSPLELSRRKDGIHPDKEGSKVWAEALLTWFTDNPPTFAQPEAP